MNLNAINCQIGQMPDLLLNGSMSSHSDEELLTFAGSFEQCRDILYREVLHRRELEREANPVKDGLAVGGLLDGLLPPKDGGAA